MQSGVRLRTGLAAGVILAGLAAGGCESSSPPAATKIPRQPTVAPATEAPSSSEPADLTSAAPASTPSTPATSTSVVPVGDAAPGIASELTFGGNGTDRGVSITETGDGGFVLAGVTVSFGAGGEDAYLVRTDRDGVELWSRAYGGPSGDSGWSVVEAPDGGFIVTGFTSSFGAGATDVYLFRTDAAGELVWEKTFGGEGEEHGWAIEPLSEGGYAIAAQTDSTGAGLLDAYLLRVDEDGEEIWSRTYGGEGVDRVFALRQTPGGGFIAVGITESFDAVGRDAYVIKTDASGELEWQRTFGEDGDDVAHSVDLTDDGGYLVMGYTNGFGARSYDAYLVKLDASGDEEWTQMFGGPSDDRIITGRRTADAGFILVGYTRSSGAGGWDAYLVKVDAFGEPEWSETFGGPRDDTGYSVIETSDGAFVLIGETIVGTLKDMYVVKVRGA